MLGSIALHTLLLGVIGAVLMQRMSSHLANGSTAAVTTLVLARPIAAATPAPPTPVPPIKIASAPTPQKAAPPPEGGVPVLAVQPKAVPALTPKPLALASPAPQLAKVVHHAPPRAQPVAVASTAHVAPVASSFAAGENVFAHPPYPEEARERGDAGTVKVNVAFDAGGRVAGVEITQSSGSLILDQQTATFIRANWHSAAEAGQVVCVPVRYSLENL